ncbi:MAG: hypothetical protein ACFE9S_01005 [Candidatus Hermodarchaeota archaeon]
MLREFEVTDTYLVRIKFEKPEGVVYRNIKAIYYPEFLEEYPKKMLLKGFKIAEIKVMKRYPSDIVQ